ncbi:hypothetical protein [Saccharopolyspora sp. NPDC049357]|uniref:ATP-dependent DNA ligase n=1 Tax=Saccharopolyspora sp. NPDC049357 TaxID=3154507 RepID=UPI003435CD66
MDTRGTWSATATRAGHCTGAARLSSNIEVAMPLQLPIDLAETRAVDHVPTGDDWSYEAKLDGWRGAVSSRGLWSRARRALTSRFPEIVAAVAELGDAVLDGEIVAFRDTGRLDFSALQNSPQHRKQAGVTVYYVAFDLLAHHDVDLRPQPYHRRRDALNELLSTSHQGLVQPVPATPERSEALTWLDPTWAAVGVEGVVAKPRNAAYLAGRRSGWRKTRTITTTEAAVLGVTATSLVLGLPTRSGRWRPAGITQPLPHNLATELTSRLHASGSPTQLPGTVAGLPGQADDVWYQPTVIDTVVEIAVDGAFEFGRWRHRPQLIRVRGDLVPDDLGAHARGER